MYADLDALVGAVSAVASNGPVVIVAAPKQAGRAKRYARETGYEAFVSNGLSDGTVLAVAANALASALDPAPRFELADQATLHFEDSSPLPISTAGTPNSVAAVVSSNFQADSVSLRVIFDCSWALRSSSGLAWASVSW
jgi:hypothetical protein